MVRKPGFSLVELVIVVVIIGVIAAIAVPRISRGASGASKAAVRANLDALRTAIDMYSGEHGGAWPGADESESTFIDQLTKRTNSAGAIGTTAGVHIYGPYLRSLSPIPVGPNIGASGIVFKNNGQVVEGEADKGWVYNWETGDIYANTNALDENGVGYSTY